MPNRLSDLEHYGKVREGWLLDTNIISAVIGDRPLHPGLTHFFEDVRDETLRLSVLTIGEIHKGIELLPLPLTETDPNAWAKSKRYILEGKLEELEAVWADRILPIDTAVATKWADLSARYQLRGSPIAAIDGLIAATAYVHHLVLVSNDAIFARMREYIIVYDPLSHGQVRPPDPGKVAEP